jgi:hypothetical protein
MQRDARDERDADWRFRSTQRDADCICMTLLLRFCDEIDELVLFSDARMPGFWPDAKQKKLFSDDSSHHFRFFSEHNRVASDSVSEGGRLPRLPLQTPIHSHYYHYRHYYHYSRTARQPGATCGVRLWSGEAVR